METENINLECASQFAESLEQAHMQYGRSIFATEKRYFAVVAY